MNKELCAAAFLAIAGNSSLRTVLTGIALLSNEHGVCNLSQAEIAKKLKVSRSVISRAIDPLTKAGFLTQNQFGEIVVTLPFVADSNNSVADSNNSVAHSNNSVADSNNSVADSNNSVAHSNNLPDNPPQKSASPLQPPIYTGTITPPSIEALKINNNITGSNNREGFLGERAVDVVCERDLFSDRTRFRKECLARIMKRGYSRQEAESGLNAVWDEIAQVGDELREHHNPEINNPRKYLIAIAANKAIATCETTKEQSRRDTIETYRAVRDALADARAKVYSACKAQRDLAESSGEKREWLEFVVSQGRKAEPQIVELEKRLETIKSQLAA